MPSSLLRRPMAASGKIRRLARRPGLRRRLCNPASAGVGELPKERQRRLKLFFRRARGVRRRVSDVASEGDSLAYDGQWEQERRGPTNLLSGSGGGGSSPRAHGSHARNEWRRATHGRRRAPPPRHRRGLKLAQRPPPWPRPWCPFPPRPSCPGARQRALLIRARQSRTDGGFW